MAETENSLEPDDKNDELDVDKEIDINLIQTFPASDPPSWTLGHDHEPKPALKKKTVGATAKDPPRKQ